MAFSDVDQIPKMRLTPSFSPHPYSLASVLILKSTCGIFMLFIVFGIACNHHFNSSIARVFMHSFASKFQAVFFKNSVFSFSKFRWCNFPNGFVGNIEIRDPITDANFLMLDYGSFKRFLIYV